MVFRRDLRKVELSAYHGWDMSEVLNSSAWRAACGVIAAPGLPRVVPSGEMRWLSSFVDSVRPDLEEDVSHLLNLPKPALRYRYAASYGEYVAEWLGRYTSAQLNGPEAEELGRKAGSEAVGVSGAYWPWNEEVWFVAPNLLLEAGQAGDLAATVYMTGGHEVTHGTLRQGVPWLRNYMNTVYSLSEPIDDAWRGELRRNPHPWIPLEAYASRRAAQSLWETVRYTDEGTSEVMSWGVVDRGVARQRLRPESATSVLRRRVMALNDPRLETYGTGVRLPAAAIEHGRVGVDLLWQRPATEHEVEQPGLWVASELPAGGMFGRPPALASPRRNESRPLRNAG